jgi:hypothetical protein
MADLDWEKEMEFACPANKLGRITVYQAGRHGALDGAGAPGFLYAIDPQGGRFTVFNSRNGFSKSYVAR